MKTGSKSKLPSYVAWILSGLIYIALLTMYVLSVLNAMPAKGKYSVYRLPYMPANLEIIQVDAGGAVVREYSLGDYINNTSETEGTHFLSVEMLGYSTILHYYYEKPDSLVLRHYSEEIREQEYKKWLVRGNYVNGDCDVRDGNIVLGAIFDEKGALFLPGMLALCATCVYWGLIDLYRKHLRRRWWVPKTF
jgi:hypothetical protein